MESRKAIISLLVLSVTVNGGEVYKWQKQNNIMVSIFRPQNVSQGVMTLQQEASEGNIEAESDLTLAMLLGLGVDQDINEAAKTSSSLVDEYGGARAHTTLGLLLMHNLTATHMPEDQRQTKALSHYVRAAMKKDPLAEIIVGSHYMKMKDCKAALMYFRRAALSVTPSLSEEMMMPQLPQYVWPEDDPMKDERYTLEELHYMEHLASHGDTSAAVKAAVMLHRGIPGHIQDVPQAVKYLRQAVDANSTSAMVLLSAMLLHHHLLQDEVDVHHLLHTALARGDVTAHAYLGLLYYRGHASTPRNIEKAKFHLAKGASHGIVEAYYQLGSLLAESSEAGMEDAATLWDISASVGHTLSAYRIGEKYWRELSHSDNVATSRDSTSVFAASMCNAAVSMYWKVALAGDWRYLFDSAYDDYLDGRYAMALIKYLLLSDLGYTTAHINAGRLLDAGGSNVYGEKDGLSEATKVWQRAADNGATSGYLRLGDLHYYGNRLSQNLTTALTQYAHAARLGNAHAMFNMAYMVEWGEGGTQNLTKAREMYEATQAMDDDATIPVTLALLRMDLFRYLHNALGVNLYVVDWTLPVEWQIPRLSNQTLAIDMSYIPEWDILAMIVLACVILVLLTVARGQQPPV